jgi:hypothetical protein
LPATRADPKAFVLLPVVDQDIAWRSVQALLFGAAAADLDVIAKVPHDPCPLVLRATNAGKKKGPMRRAGGPSSASAGCPVRS